MYFHTFLSYEFKTRYVQRGWEIQLVGAIVYIVRHLIINFESFMIILRRNLEKPRLGVDKRISVCFLQRLIVGENYSSIQG